MLPNPEVQPVTLQDYLKVIRKRIYIFIPLIVIIPLAATIYIYNQKPLYRATASIEVGKVLPRVTRFEDVTQSMSFYFDFRYYETQREILMSRALAEKVAEQLQLAKDPEYTGDPAGRVKSQISVEFVKDSKIALVNVIDTDPVRATTIANTLAKAYIEQDVEAKNKAAKEAIVWLQAQVEETRKKMFESQMVLNNYIEKNKIIMITQRKGESETVLANLKMQKAQLGNALAETYKRYKEKHPVIIGLNAQLEETTRSIENETKILFDLNKRMVQYDLLKKDVDSNQAIHTALLTRLKETGITEKLEKGTVSILDFARPPGAPFKPQKGKTIFLSIMVSLICGVGLAFFVEYLDSTIHTAEDVSIFLNLPFLGYIPMVTKDLKTGKEIGLICHEQPRSIIAESFRTVRTSILFAAPEDKPFKTILVSSSIPQEGKSFMVSNLSIIFTQLNYPVVLLDLDMRRPIMHKTFNLERKVGMSDFLAGNIEPDKIIKQTSIPNLSVITSGTFPPNPSELISSGKMPVLLEYLKSRFNYIFIDCPPLLTTVDAPLLVNLVDGVLLVIKGASTHLEAITRAKKKIEEAKSHRIIGTIINNIKSQKEYAYYYYHYYYHTEEEKKKK
jgi:capsular exopolysaccharide synthesis family protein